MAVPISVLMSGIFAWTLPAAIGYGLSDLDAILFWTKIEFIGIALTPVAYLFVALRYGGYERWFSPQAYGILGLIPASTLAVVWTNSYHNLYWESLELGTTAGVSVMVATHGPWYWVTLLYSYLVVAGALIILGHQAFRSNPLHRTQSILMFLAGLVPLAINVATVFEVVPYSELDLTAPALAISGLLFALLLFRYDFLDLSPVAYRNVSDLFGDGVLVFDDQETLVEYNDAAAGVLEYSLECGMAAPTIFDAPIDHLDGTVLRRGGKHTRYYSIRREPIHDNWGRTAGHLVVLRDVTDLKAHEQRLDVSSRILRHNLRNELNIILGGLYGLESSTPDDSSDFQMIDAAANRLLKLSERARYIQSSTEWLEASYSPTDVREAASLVVADLQTQYPDATIAIDAEKTASILAPTPKALQIVLETLVENAIVHDESSAPTVSIGVSVDADSNHVKISVGDSGPGIPDGELEVLEEGRETPLQHGSGLGLWLVHWFVSMLDGTIEFEDRNPRGTRVEMRFPVVDSDELATC